MNYLKDIVCKNQNDTLENFQLIISDSITNIDGRTIARATRSIVKMPGRSFNSKKSLSSNAHHFLDIFLGIHLDK